MATIFVSRHQGAMDWAREEGLLPDDARIVADFSPEVVQPGDIVIGTLPAQLAARICELGGRYWHLSLDLPVEWRGRELSAEDMRRCGARIEEFFIQRTSVSAGAQRELAHVCIASDETLQNLIPALSPDIRANRVLILASARMQASANRLAHGLETAGLGRDKVSIRADLPDRDFHAIVGYGERVVQSLQQSWPECALVLNATGGTKLMATALVQAFRPVARIIYCDTEHDRIEFLHPPGTRALPLPVNLVKRDVYLAVQGYRARPDVIAMEAVLAREVATRMLATEAPRIDRLIGILNGAARAFELGQLDRAWLERPRRAAEEAVLAALVEARLVKPKGRGYEIADLSSATYLKGGWLEELCAVVAKSLEEGESGRRLHANRWGINVRVDLYDQVILPGQNQFALNELDALIVHRNKLLLIECKSGVQISERGESQDILNRLEALGRHVGGRLDTKWLVTARTLQKNSQALQRAASYKIRIVTPEELAHFRQLVLDWMSS